MRSLTVGQLRDLLDRALVVIEESEGADEHGDLLRDLREAKAMIRREIGASHMGTGDDVVVIGEEVARG